MARINIDYILEQNRPGEPFGPNILRAFAQMEFSESLARERKWPAAKKPDLPLTPSPHWESSVRNRCRLPCDRPTRLPFRAYPRAASSIRNPCRHRNRRKRTGRTIL